MSVRLFVGNLPYEVTEAELREFFSPVGQLSYVYFPVDRDTGRRRGFAFVELGDRGQADEAIRRFNNQMFKGRAVAVNEARAREQRPPGAPRPASPRPFTPRISSPGSVQPGFMPEPATDDSRRRRNFGPDAKPKNRRNFTGRVNRTEGGKRGKPIRERTSGQVFGALDDDSDDLMLADEPQDDLMLAEEPEFEEEEDEA